MLGIWSDVASYVGKSLLWLAFLALGLAVASFSVGAAFRYGLMTADPETPTWIHATALAGVDALKCVLPAVLLLAWRAQLRGLVVAGVAVWFGLTLLSVWAVVSIDTLARSAHTAVEERASDAVADLRANIERSLASLAQMGSVRPAAAIEAELKADRLNPLFAASEGCTKPTSATARVYCQRDGRRFSELATAVKAEQLQDRIDSARRQLEEALRSKPLTKANAELLLLADLTAMPSDRIGFVRAILLALLVSVAPDVALMLGAGLRPAWRAYVSPAVSTRDAPALPQPAEEAENTGVTPRPALATSKAGDTASPPMAANDDVVRGHRTHPTGQPRHPVSPGCGGQISRQVNRSQLRLVVGSNVAAFARERLVQAKGTRTAAGDIRREYEIWCQTRGETVTDWNRFGYELADLGYGKHKSRGVVRYVDVCLARPRTAAAS